MRKDGVGDVANILWPSVLGVHILRLVASSITTVMASSPDCPSGWTTAFVELAIIARLDGTTYHPSTQEVKANRS